MNTGNYQNAPGPGVVTPGDQQLESGRSISHHIIRLLQQQHQQQPPQGWRTEISIQQRVFMVHQLVSSIRLDRADYDIERTLGPAMSLERKVYDDSADKAAYEQACKQKLTDIATSRSRQANITMQQSQNPQSQPMNLAHQQMQMQGMVTAQNLAQFQHGYLNPQLQQPMQQPLMHQQHQMQMGNPHMNMQHMPQNVHPQMQPHPGRTVFTPEENQLINRNAQQLAQNTPRDQLEAIRTTLQNLRPEQRQMIQRQNTNVLMYFFRNQAIKQYLEHKARMTAPRPNQVIAPTSNGLMPQQAQPTSQNSTPSQPQPNNAQMFDSGFMGNMDQFLGQQQDGLRSQEAGQVVVPASNSQGIAEAQRGNARGNLQQQQQQQQHNAQLGANHPSHPQPPQYWPNLNPSMQQPPQMQQPPLGSSFGNMQPHLQGQLGGLKTPTGRMAPQNPPMPTLTKGLGVSPHAQNTWPPQRHPQSNEQPVPGAQPVTPQLGGAPSEPPEVNQQRSRMGSNITLAMQRHLASLTEDQQRDRIAQVQRHRRNPQQGGGPAKLPDSQKGQNATPMIGHQPPPPGSNKAVATPLNDTPHPAVSQHPPLTTDPGLQTTPPPKIPQQQMMQVPHAQPSSFPLSEEQARQMDELNFPKGILNATSALSQLPQGVTTWGQLISWVAQNAQTLPPASLQKLRGLQALHYQNLANRQRQQQRPSGGQPRPTSTQGVIQPAAPTAPMVPQRTSTAGANGPQPTPNMIQNIPPPTVQEIQAARARLPPNRVYTDSQVGSIIMKQRHDVLRNANSQQRAGPQQPPYNNLQRSQYPQGLHLPVPSPINQTPQAPQPATQQRQPPPHTQRSAPTPKTTTPKQTPNNSRNATQAPNPAPANPKGVKRNSNDDVVEIPHPNAAQQDAQPKSQPSPQPRANPPQKAHGQFHATLSDQKAALEGQRRAQASQHAHARSGQSSAPGTNGQSADSNRTEEHAKTELRLKQMVEEFAQSNPPRPPVPMNAQTKGKMIQKLRESRNWVQRMEGSLISFFKTFTDERTIMDFLRMRTLLIQQYQDTQNFVPVDHPTITLEELQNAIHELAKFFKIMQTLASQTTLPTSGQSAGQLTTPQPQRVIPLDQAPKPEVPSLNAANLKQHENAQQAARQAVVQKSHASNRAPAAPTSPQPPFTLGGQPPQGLPNYLDRPNALTRDKLNLPLAKRRKPMPGPATISTPDLGTASSKSPPLLKHEPKEVQPGTPPSIAIKCTVPHCEASPKGFATQEDLNKHTSEVHRPKELPIGEPLPWALEQMRESLGLDEQGKSKPLKQELRTEKEGSQAPNMKKSASTQGQSAIKQESATPMTRVPTQPGRSPTSTPLKTPQAAANTKTPTSEAKFGRKESKSTEAKPSTTGTAKSSGTLPDPWAGSRVPSAVITEAWSGLADLQSLGSWSTVQHTLTPPSTLSSGRSEKNSPRVSDISENDAVKINLTVDDDGIFVPWDLSYQDLDHGMEALDVRYLGQDWEGMDWEATFGAEGTANNAAGGGEDGNLALDMPPSADWFTIYTPDNTDHTAG